MDKVLAGGLLIGLLVVLNGIAIGFASLYHERLISKIYLWGLLCSLIAGTAYCAYIVIWG